MWRCLFAGMCMMVKMLLKIVLSVVRLKISLKNSRKMRTRSSAPGLAMIYTCNYLLS